ncbi:HEAT repeat domain-containing protein [Halococcus sp. AFM35]|uniref:HEAT repeat domain-containing protein n=1 Tax=Halococcus sp. AFM35 TaxID=3421653 RepID=UPI003EBE366B
MERTLTAFFEALWSGDTEQVNRALDEVHEMELEEQAELFDEGFEICRELYAEGDGYQRQSAIRFAAELYPRLAFRTVGSEFTDDALPGDHTTAETASHRERLRELYLNALTDDDGRVRRAAAKAIKSLALTAEIIENEDELQRLIKELESLKASHTDPERKHIQQAYENVTFHTNKPFSVLSNAMDEIFDGSRPPGGP